MKVRELGAMLGHVAEPLCPRKRQAARVMLSYDFIPHMSLIFSYSARASLWMDRGASNSFHTALHETSCSPPYTR